MDRISPAGNTGRLQGITRNAFQHPSADLLSSFATDYATGIACEAGVAVVKINYSKFNSPGIEKPDTLSSLYMILGLNGRRNDGIPDISSGAARESG